MKIPFLFVALLVVVPCLLAGKERVPDGFVMQALEPFGGKIVRPKDWYFTESHRGPVYLWTIAKEKRPDGSYDTGVRIQLLIGVQRATGTSPADFVANFIKKQRASSARILNDCPPLDQGLFNRRCLEAEEGPYHVVYSLFSGNRDIDMVVVMSAGAKRDEWSEYADTFALMNRLDLIDMNRIEPFIRQTEPSAKEPAPPPRTATGFELASVILYNRESELADRVSVGELSGYINRLKAKFGKLYAGDQRSRNFLAVFCVQPDRAHVWFTDRNGTEVHEPPDVSKQLVKVPPPQLKKPAPVVFALDVQIAGGGGGSNQRVGQPITPVAWKEAIARAGEKEPLRIDDLMRLVCPE